VLLAGVSEMQKTLERLTAMALTGAILVVVSTALIELAA
jgi:hypothetical protein